MPHRGVDRHDGAGRAGWHRQVVVARHRPEDPDAIEFADPPVRFGAGGRDSGGERDVGIEPLRHAAAFDGQDDGFGHVGEGEQIVFDVG